MEYKKVVEGIFLKRPNRFIAHVLINDIEEIVHVKNTGRCKELLIPGARVILEDCSANLNRKTKYSLIAVYKGDILVNMDSQVPNQVVFNALVENKVNGLLNLSYIKKEVSYKNSRFDIAFGDGEKEGFIEVKGVTLEEDGIAMFPDAPTTRGTKHIHEMIDAVENGYLGYIFFLVQMKKPEKFIPNWKMDKDFSQGVKLARESGVGILCYDSIVEENSIRLGNPIPIMIG